MGGRFERGRERAAQDRAAQAEVDRLVSLPCDERAVELMGAFADVDGARAGLLARNVNVLAVIEWLLRAHARTGAHLLALQAPVRESLALLERSGLIEWRGSEMVDAKARITATALGRVALARGRVWEYLEPDN